MWWLLWLIPAAIAIFLAVILFRAVGFKPKAQPTPDQTSVSFDGDRAVDALRRLVQCKTISYSDPTKEDDAEFQKLIGLLPTLYPNVFGACEQISLPDRALLFRWKGENEGEAAVMMAHYDVVPVKEDAWELPPFEGILKDGCLWGRGTLDTKVTMNGILFAADHLIAEGFVPKQDIYFAFSGGEEVNGMGAVRIVDYFEEQGIVPSFVIDEGGAVVENVFPGVKSPCGLIGIAEKGMMNVQYTVHSAGGHASAPKPGAPVDRLSKACVKVLNKPFQAKLTPPAAQMFDTLGRYSSFVYRIIFANIKLFLPVLDLICKKSGGELNALMRTTVAFTQMEGSSAPNVIPPEATMISNLRLNPADHVKESLTYLQNTVDDPSVELSILHSMEPSRISRTDCEGWEKVATAVASTWKGCIVAPYLMVQCSDCRHWGRLSDRVYRFSAMDLTSEERATIHGNNEKIRVDALHRTVEFYLRLMKSC